MARSGEKAIDHTEKIAIMIGNLRPLPVNTESFKSVLIKVLRDLNRRIDEIEHATEQIRKTEPNNIRAK